LAGRLNSRKGASGWPKILGLWLGLLSLFVLTSCSLPQVRAEARIFLNLQLGFLGEYALPVREFEQTQVGGLSGLTYDRQRDRFYAVSDDRSQRSPARFYTLKLDLKPGLPPDLPPVQSSAIERMTLERVTLLKTPQGELYPANSLDPEGIAFRSSQSNALTSLSNNPADDLATVLISSEGVVNQAPPFIQEFEIQTGALQQSLPLPPYFLARPPAPATSTAPSNSGNPTGRPANPATSPPPQGVADNLGFESLTLAPSGDRLFAATESNLLQDLDPTAAVPARARILHYLLADPRPQIVSEHLYELEPTPPGATFHGLVELLAIDNAGHFLSLERTFNPETGISAKLFQISTAAATDISGRAALKGPLASLAGGIKPVRKQLLFDLTQLGVTLDNVEGMTFGPQLPDGSQSLLLVSDNNFLTPTTQFLLFRYQIKGLSSGS
jgi:hypothetical protein